MGSTYRLAYRRFVDIHRELNVTNVRWVWHSAIHPTYQDHSVTAWYPGDEYVDLFGASIFTAFYPDDHPYKKFFWQSIDNLTTFADLGVAQGKPLAIMESTARSFHMTDDTAQLAWDVWFRPLFAFIEQHDVRLLAYINCHWDVQAMWKGNTWGDTRLQGNEFLTTRWKEEMSKPRWHPKLQPLKT